MRPLIANSPATLLAILTAALISLGVVMVYSASGARAGLETQRAIARSEAPPLEEAFVSQHNTAYLVQQAGGAVIGLVLLIILARVPMEWIEKAAPWIMVASILLLLAVLTPLGVTSKGARRWLNLGVATIQPAEFAKLGLVIFMARFLADKREGIRDFLRGFLPAVAIWGVFAALIVLEKDLGTIILMGTVMMGMWLMTRMKLWHLATLAVASLPAVVGLVLLEPYRVKRVLAYLNPEAYLSTAGYQLHQSLIAVGSGGLFGAGLGEGLQKYHFLSESHTDFIFAIVCEELGLIGALSVVVLFLAFALTGFLISYRAPDYFGGLVAGGLTMTIACAAFINFFVVLGLAPTKGLALPFFTYGRSSMIASMMAVGLLINIANYTATLRGSGGAARA